MKIRSLGYKTDFIFNKLDGEVIDKGPYIKASTKSNPNYFWGNLLLYKEPPHDGVLDSWIQDFKSEFNNTDTYHITLAWDSPEGNLGSINQFKDQGFDVEVGIVLTSNNVCLPPKYNEEIELITIQSDHEFERCIEIQLSSASDRLSKESWESFYRKSMDQYKTLIKQDVGMWFGAKLKNQIVGSLGIFRDGDLGRFQVVSTHKDFQRLGVCSSLVYDSAIFAFNNMGIKTLVMVADADYHAAKIYESVGFQPTEKVVGVCWFDKNRHT